jgi:hypothetical protein
MARVKAAFIFVALDVDLNDNCKQFLTPEALDLMVIGVRDYQQAAKVAKDLAEKGYTAIELCGGFGNLGVAIVAQAVGNKAAVGAIRFDCHPSLKCKSGDDINLGSACINVSYNCSTI